MKVTVDVEVTPQVLAEAFAAMDDEAQAQFFIEVAALARKWKDADPGRQWFAVGRHLRTCTCSTEEARDLVREIATGVDA
jgi:hypothetical protein